MSNYTAAPPSYQSVSPTKSRDEEAAQPLLNTRAGPSASGGAYFDQPDADDLPDDFKYGTSVSDSAPEIRRAFVRKVYSILFVQILATCIVAGVVSHSPSAIVWVQQNTWALYVPLFGTLINLGVLYWKRHSHPLNLFLLGSFTLLEAWALGIMTAFFDNSIVLQALLITLGVFLGLTLFTFQSKYDFSGMGPWLFGGLMALMMTGVVGIFIPFGRTMDMVYAGGGCLLFSGYIVYDTYNINNRLSPDEYIMAAISLYLDFINLFINILRLLNNAQEN
ncbi:hypothetical protein EUX98_g879 [Antrodiella citrinella]|uniref:Uncharacterized protein n=1 Tax=Antrodiella citrinella TaxID=2447956 RepID=A0A4S4N5T9_9APHY|nr:hypothetical protein EUX98_g879 [Antrodiella citrinella]